MPPLGPYHSQPCPVTRATSRPFQPPPSSLSRTPLAIILPWYLRCKMATWPYALLTVSCILILKKIQGGREKEQSVQFIFNDRRPQRHPRWLRDESRFPFFSSLLPPPLPSPPSPSFLFFFQSGAVIQEFAWLLIVYGREILNGLKTARRNNGTNSPAPLRSSPSFPLPFGHRCCNYNSRYGRTTRYHRWHFLSTSRA